MCMGIAQKTNGKKLQWIKKPGNHFTPGGDPLYICPNCNKGEHIYGIENISGGPKDRCPDCGMGLGGYAF